MECCSAMHNPAMFVCCTGSRRLVSTLLLGRVEYKSSAAHTKIEYVRASCNRALMASINARKKYGFDGPKVKIKHAVLYSVGYGFHRVQMFNFFFTIGPRYWRSTPQNLFQQQNRARQHSMH